MKLPASARGLFRATGKKSKPVAVRQLDGSYTKTDQLVRERDEFYPTPPEPTRAFLHAEGDRLRELGLPIWEPAAGDGKMAREFERMGFTVCKSDLVDRGCGAEIMSFYDFDFPLSPVAITNPPFAECNWGYGNARWLYHGLERLKLEYFALLMSWQWPGAAGLDQFWTRYPPARIYLMRWKIDFTGQGSPPMLNAWYVWDKEQSYCGETFLRMLDRKDAAQGELEL